MLVCFLFGLECNGKLNVLNTGIDGLSTWKILGCFDLNCGLFIVAKGRKEGRERERERKEIKRGVEKRNKETELQEEIERKKLGMKERISFLIFNIIFDLSLIPLRAKPVGELVKSGTKKFHSPIH